MMMIIWDQARFSSLVYWFVRWPAVIVSIEWGSELSTGEFETFGHSEKGGKSGKEELRELMREVLR